MLMKLIQTLISFIFKPKKKSFTAAQHKQNKILFNLITYFT